MAPAPLQPFCPTCGCAVREHVAADAECPECASARAWRMHGEGAERLVLDLPAIEAAEARRRSADAGRGVVSRALQHVPTVAALVLGVAAALAFVPLVTFRPFGPLDDVFAAWRADARLAALVGVAALGAALAAFVHARRTRLFRRPHVFTTVGLALLSGALATAVGALTWSSLRRPGDFEHAVPPPLPLRVADETTGALMAATVAIAAPGSDGDARDLALGGGAIVRSEPGRAWIVTCSHVALPYDSPAAFHDLAAAPRVWVQFSDGRGAYGTVRWCAPPPLDIALVSADIEAPPAAVDVLDDGSELEAGRTALFVPNPLRAGWRLHRGSVLRRRTHTTPAGTYALIYTDLPLQPGDSGTGLYDADGRLMGVSTWAGVEATGPVGIGLPPEALAGLLDATSAAAPAVQAEAAGPAEDTR